MASWVQSQRKAAEGVLGTLIQRDPRAAIPNRFGTEAIASKSGLRSHLIHVDSRERNYPENPNANEFVVLLKRPYRGVHSIELTHAIIPIIGVQPYIVLELLELGGTQFSERAAGTDTLYQNSAMDNIFAKIPLYQPGVSPLTAGSTAVSGSAQHNALIALVAGVWTTITTWALTGVVAPFTYGVEFAAGVFTAPHNGSWFFAGQVGFDGNVGERSVRLLRNGAVVDELETSRANTIVGGFTSVAYGALLELVAGDTIALQGMGSVGTNTQVAAYTTFSYMESLHGLGGGMAAWTPCADAKAIRYFFPPLRMMDKLHLRLKQWGAAGAALGTWALYGTVNEVQPVPPVLMPATNNVYFSFEIIAED